MKIKSSNVEMEGHQRSLYVEENFVTHSFKLTSGKAVSPEELKENTEKENAQDEEAATLAISQGGRDALQKSGGVYRVMGHRKPIDYNGYESAIETLKSLIKMLRSLGGSSKAIKALQDMVSQQESLLKMYQDSAKGSQYDIMELDYPVFWGGNMRTYTETTHEENFVAEKEYVQFAAKGVAKTEDGRDIEFNVDMSMSREFMSYTQIDSETMRTMFCDPLVINTGAHISHVSNQKFQFDLDMDGKKDSISCLDEGSGFLALDLNENGTIDDGSELFGTKSGDGFKDLAVYDEDGNGWIDENDSVYGKLKVWYKSGEGKDALVGLMEADVGAIYLGNVKTEYTMKNADNSTVNGMIRSSGIYVKENGGTGIIQHVDLAL